MIECYGHFVMYPRYARGHPPGSFSFMEFSISVLSRVFINILPAIYLLLLTRYETQHLDIMGL